MTDAEDLIGRLKEQLRREILSMIRDWDQYIAAERLATTQPRISNLHHGRLERFSLEWLIRLLAKLEHRVDLTVVNLAPEKPRRFRVFPRR